MARAYSEAASQRQPVAAQRWTAATAGWWQCGSGAGVGAGGGLGKGSGGGMARSSAARAGVGAAQCALGRQRPAGLGLSEAFYTREDKGCLQTIEGPAISYGYNSWICTSHRIIPVLKYFNILGMV
ncbi:unnamed protein product [Miscanthus lutarioriparius]|uniref:Uncharacterized protein n=1 Tax=Miscanthus lutarioriparius TaxID=422564 RepID=A0A811RUU5_9POAL|nr:unnamed protein product [Miscanthus lutarioriparius]